MFLYILSRPYDDDGCHANICLNLQNQWDCLETSSVASGTLVPYTGIK